MTATTGAAHPTLPLYRNVFVVLLVLLVVTVTIAEIDLGPWNFLAAAGIASCKAVLIILFFMHVRYSTRLTWLVAAASFVWLAILFGLTFNDYVTRGAREGIRMEPKSVQPPG